MKPGFKIPRKKNSSLELKLEHLMQTTIILRNEADLSRKSRMDFNWGLNES